MRRGALQKRMNDMARTFFGAFATARAFVIIDHSKIFKYLDRTLLTGAAAKATADTTRAAKRG